MPFANYFFSVEGAEKKKHLIFWSKIVQGKLNELFLWKRKGEHSLWYTVGANEGKGLVAEMAEILAKIDL